MVWMTYDHVVEHFDFDQLPRSDQIARHFDVRLGRRRFAAGMVVKGDDGRRSYDDRRAKHFPWMHEDRVECANRNQLVPANSSAGVEHQDGEALTVRVEV